MAVLDALAFSPVRDKVIPASLPKELHDDVRSTIARLATRIPKIAHIFEIAPDRNAPRPKVERRKPKKQPPKPKQRRQAEADKPQGRGDRRPTPSRRPSAEPEAEARRPDGAEAESPRPRSPCRARAPSAGEAAGGAGVSPADQAEGGSADPEPAQREPEASTEPEPPRRARRRRADERLARGRRPQAAELEAPTAVLAGDRILVPAGAARRARARVEPERGEVEALHLVGLAEGALQVPGSFAHFRQGNATWLTCPPCLSTTRSAARSPSSRSTGPRPATP